MMYNINSDNVCKTCIIHNYISNLWGKLAEVIIQSYHSLPANFGDTLFLLDFINACEPCMFSLIHGQDELLTESIGVCHWVGLILPFIEGGGSYRDYHIGMHAYQLMHIINPVDITKAHLCVHEGVAVCFHS